MFSEHFSKRPAGALAYEALNFWFFSFKRKEHEKPFKSIIRIINDMLNLTPIRQPSGSQRSNGFPCGTCVDSYFVLFVLKKRQNTLLVLTPRTQRFTQGTQ
jgi:hypothetical protein